MARVPIGPIIEGIKKYGPKAGKLLKENWKEVAGVVGALGTGGKAIKESIDKNKDIKQRQGKLHYRKERFDHYKATVLRELDNKNRNELFQYILEIEQFIEQIEDEQNKELGVKKPIHSRRINNWQDILIQIQDKKNSQDYLELLKIYNSPNYQSDYFKGFENHVEKFKQLMNSGNHENLVSFISEQTNKSIEQIKKDFPL